MKKGLLITLGFIGVFIANTVWALSPPPYSLQRKLLSTVGDSTCAYVGDVVERTPTNYVIDISTCDGDVANSLAFLLISSWTYGSETVHIRIFRPDGTQVTKPNRNPWGVSKVEAVNRHFQTALQSNNLFVTTHGKIPVPLSQTLIWVEVAKEVLQFWNDDISDYYGNTNIVAREVFAELFKANFFNNTVPVNWTTTPDSP